MTFVVQHQEGLNNRERRILNMHRHIIKSVLCFSSIHEKMCEAHVNIFHAVTGKPIPPPNYT